MTIKVFSAPQPNRYSMYDNLPQEILDSSLELEIGDLPHPTRDGRDLTKEKFYEILLNGETKRYIKSNPDKELILYSNDYTTLFTGELPNNVTLMAPAIIKSDVNTRYFPMFWVHWSRKSGPTVDTVNERIRAKKFTNLNRIWKPVRQLLVDYIVDNDYLHYGYVSNLAFTYDKEQLQEPLYASLEKSGGDIFDLSTKDYNMDSRFYTEAYWNIISETNYGTHVDGFITEKTYKPIMNMQPFVTVSSPKSLKVLQTLGFKTFGDYIDESYDNEMDVIERFRKIKALIKQFAEMSDAEHISLIKHIKPILEHNKRHFFSLNDDDIKRMLVDDELTTRLKEI